jgi:transposase
MNYRTSIGLDVHARSIKAAAFIPETGEIVHKSFAYEAEAIANWALKLPHPVHAVYESGPTGFDLARNLNRQGVECEVGAISKMLRPVGDRVKTDRRDAVFLARMLAVGNIVSVYMPSPTIEAARDLSRCREDAREDLTRAKHQLSKFLLRKGILYADGTPWTLKHSNWLTKLSFDLAGEQFVFEEYLGAIATAEGRRDRLNAKIKEMAKTSEFASTVTRLRCLRGIDTISAFAIAAEIGDFNRFARPTAFGSFIGLTPSEFSSGESISRGGITKTGNSHVRRLLVEAGHLQGRPYNPKSVTVSQAMRSVPAPIAALADKANRRLHKRTVHLKARGKHPCLVNAAIARELASWVWIMATSYT